MVNPWLATCDTRCTGALPSERVRSRTVGEAHLQVPLGNPLHLSGAGDHFTSLRDVMGGSAPIRRQGHIRVFHLERCHEQFT
jgi:hypothetical protein